MENVFDVAKWFLGENRCRMLLDDAEYITNLKLQKLLYYAQGAYLAIFNEPLFKEKIVAWQHGPAVPEVYFKYKRFKINGIDESDVNYITDFNEQTDSLLKEVFDKFGCYSAWKLREITHDETPWKSTPINSEINLNIIKKYFLENYIEE